VRPGGGRQKGAAFEREVAGMLMDELGIQFKREIEQYRQSDLGDLRPVDAAFPFVIECKRYKDGAVQQAWWDQVCAAADAAKLLPALVYRFDRKPIAVRVPIEAFVQMTNGEHHYDWSYNVDMTFRTWCMVARELMP